MFCPSCGKDNSLELKFCASCGTNLEAVSQALTGVEEEFFSKMDSGMDYFIARYAEHVFKDAPHGLAERGIKKSWTILGQAVVASLVDILAQEVCYEQTERRGGSHDTRPRHQEAPWPYFHSAGKKFF